MGIGLPPYLKEIIINTIGKEQYYKLCPEVKRIVLIEELRKFRAEVIARYGTENNYKKNWCKRNGYKSVWEYRFKTYKRNYGIDRPYEIINMQVTKRGFKDYKQYENWLARNKGFKDRNDYRRFKRWEKSKNTHNLHFQ